jgi:hypothetical protein
MLGPIRYFFTIIVVYEYRGGACLHIVRVVAGDQLGEYVEVVVVVAGDGKVPHPRVVDLGRGAAVGDRDTTVGGLEALTFR